MDFQRPFYINHEFENRTFDWVRLIFFLFGEFDFVRLPNSIELNPPIEFDLVWLKFSSIGFDLLCRDKGDRFNKESTETFQYTNFYSCHPPGVTKSFIKGEALRLLRTNSSQFTFEENMSNLKTRLQNRDYPARIVENTFKRLNSLIEKCR